MLLATPASIETINQKSTDSLTWMAVSVDRHLNGGMPQLFTHVLNGGVVLIEHDCSISVPEVMDADSA